jgi:hypothetical protein
VSGAEVRFVCARCSSSQLIAVSLDVLNRDDPHDNHLLQSRGESYRLFAEVRGELTWFDTHACVPGRPIDLGAPLHQQYEALSVLFAELAGAA